MNEKTDKRKRFGILRVFIGLFLLATVGFICFSLPSLTYTRNMIHSHPLTKDNTLSAWWRYGWWQIQSRLSESVEYTWIAGTKVIVKKGMHGFTGNIYSGLQDDQEMFFLIHFLRPGDLFVDVGANVGSYTLLSSAVVGAHTVAFEPDLNASSALTKNIEVNGIENLVDLRLLAVGAEKGVISFTVDRGAQNKIAEDSTVKSRDVQLVRLDDSFSDEFPLMIKIDVEGFEMPVLQGAREILRNPQLKAIVIETFSDKVSNLLWEEGFHRYTYDYEKRQLTELSKELSGETWRNQLYLRDLSFVEDRLKSATKIEVLGREY